MRARVVIVLQTSNGRWEHDENFSLSETRRII